MHDRSTRESTAACHPSIDRQPGAYVPRPRTRPEARHREEWARLLHLAAEGHLYALPSPVTGESVLLVYHLPLPHAGTHGDHADAVYLRQLVHAGLVSLADPELRFVPNGDLHRLCRVAVTTAGRRWFEAHPSLTESCVLRPADRRERSFTSSGWDTASWSGSARSR